MIKGTILQENSFYTIIEVLSDGYVVNLNGRHVKITKDYVNNFTKSADQFNQTTNITKTELNKLIESFQNTVMTICFDKQIDTSKALKLVKAGKVSEAEIALTPEVRVIKGVHWGLDDNGRYKFVDMEIELDTTKKYDNRLRQVDPRTITYAIVNNIKYIVK